MPNKAALFGNKAGSFFHAMVKLFCISFGGLKIIAYLCSMNEDKKTPEIRHYDDGTASVLRKAVVYTELRFYQRSDVLYQLTQLFCERYLPRYGDRTVDQMVQAARSTKQNIAEGSSDGQTSTETELKLLGIARGSNKELMEDYQDYLKRKGFVEWFGKNPRFERLHEFCKLHYRYEDYLHCQKHRCH